MKEMRSINNKLGCTVLCAIMLVWLSACMSTETANLEQELASATDRNSDLEKHSFAPSLAPKAGIPK